MRIFADIDFVELLAKQIARLIKKGLKRAEITKLLEEAEFEPKEIADAWAKFEREYGKFIKSPASLRLIARKLLKIRRQILNEYY